MPVYTLCFSVTAYVTQSSFSHSHYPYPCDGEGRQADRQDDPGSHWAGSELALSQAWGKRGASGRSVRHNRRDQVGGG